MITLVTGGARSGKSTFAEKICKDSGNTIGYIATSKLIDDDMKDRVAKHRANRPAEWKTFEQYRSFDSLLDNADFVACDTLLLDCITILITNIMFDEEQDYANCSNETIDRVEAIVKDELINLLSVIRSSKKNIVLVTNEVGQGIVPAYRLGSIFRDIAGRMNQFLARESDEVYCIISGLPLKLK